MVEVRIDLNQPIEAKMEDARWLEAVKLVDQDGDVEDLVGLLRGDHRLESYARALLADLIDRRLRRGKGGRPAPAYLVTKAEAELRDAAALYRYWRREPSDDLARAGDPRPLSSDKAIAEVLSEKPGLDEEKLRNFLFGRRGSTRRKTGRRPEKAPSRG
jgi:hypothetical protein